MRRLLLAFAFICFASSGAFAQNTTCATRPPSENSNACASTSFVQTAVSNIFNTACITAPTVCASIFGYVNPLWLGAVANDNTKATVNQTAFNASFALSTTIKCIQANTYYTQKITIPTTAKLMNGCNLIAAGTYAGSDGVVSIVNNTAGFLFDQGSISANGATYPTTANILATGSTNTTVSNSAFPAAARTIVGANNTNFRMLYNTITSYVYNVFFDSGGSSGVWVIGNRASGGTDTANVVWDDTAFIVVGGDRVHMKHNVTSGAKLWAYSVQTTTNFNISDNIAINGIRECITAGTSSGIVGANECSFDGTSTDYCMSFAASYTTVINNNCIESRFSGFYFLNGLGGSFENNTIATPATTNNLGSGWTLLYLEGTTTGLSIANNQVYDKYGTLSWYYWRVSGSPTGNYFYTPVGPTPLQGVFGNGLDPGTGIFRSKNIKTDLFVFNTGASSTIQATSANTGFQNTFTIQNGGTVSNTGTIAVFGASLSAGANTFLQLVVGGGANPSGKIESGTGLTGGLNIVADAGTLSLTSPTATNLTVTGSFTATGLVTNAALANPATTINGQTCTLGSTCTVSASATSITIGTTTITSGATNTILFQNGASPTGTISEIATANNGVLITSSGGVPSISSTIPTATQDNITRTGTLVSGATGAGFTLALTTSTVTGTLPCANTPAYTGDVTKASTSCTTVLATAQPAVHTWALAQTFTVPPIFTDQSGSRTALGLGTISTQSASAVAITGGTIAGLTGLAIRDTSAAFDVTIAATSSGVLSAGRTLTLNMGNVAHTLAFGTTANTITFPNVASDTVGMLATTQTWTGVNTYNTNTHYAVVGGTGAGFWLNSVTTGTDRFFFGGDAAVADSFRIFSALPGANILQYNANATLANGSMTIQGTLTTTNHIIATSTAPTVSSCGVSPSISGSDNFGTVNAGTGILSSCVVNFGVTWGTAPRCVASSSTAIASMTISTTTTQLTIGGTSLTGDAINWVCGSTAANDNIPAELMRKYA